VSSARPRHDSPRNTVRDIDFAQEGQPPCASVAVTNTRPTTLVRLADRRLQRGRLDVIALHGRWHPARRRSSRCRRRCGSPATSSTARSSRRVRSAPRRWPTAGRPVCRCGDPTNAGAPRSDLVRRRHDRRAVLDLVDLAALALADGDQASSLILSRNTANKSVIRHDRRLPRLARGSDRPRRPGSGDPPGGAVAGDRHLVVGRLPHRRPDVVWNAAAHRRPEPEARAPRYRAAPARRATAPPQPAKRVEPRPRRAIAA